MSDALHFLLLTFAGWVNRHQEAVIDYLREENRILREQLGERGLRLTNAQRRRLAVVLHAIDGERGGEAGGADRHRVA